MINHPHQRRTRSLRNLEDGGEAGRTDLEHLESLYLLSKTEILYYPSPALDELDHLLLHQLGSFTPSKFLLDHLTELL